VLVKTNAGFSLVLVSLLLVLFCSIEVDVELFLSLLDEITLFDLTEDVEEFDDEEEEEESGKHLRTSFELLVDSDKIDDRTDDLFDFVEEDNEFESMLVSNSLLSFGSV
jgi:hypothetical protein